VARRAWKRLLPRIEGLLDPLERLLELAEEWLEPRSARRPADDDEKVWAWRWRGDRLEPIRHPDVYPLGGLIGVERPIARLRSNAAAFTRGEPALDVLLHGERGTGKSSAVRGLLGEFGPAGLRLVEVQREHLLDLGPLYAALRPRPEWFVLFCDDLSFEEGDSSYKRLKAALSGGVEARPDNVILIATSNRRHLLPEHMSENLEARLDANAVLRPGETTDEKLSLADRFGLVLPFFSFDQDTFLAIVDHHAAQLGLAGRIPRDDLHARALRFALDRSNRSGRIARQACIAILQDIAMDAR
jgi:predicted AAA+ superfamily ATPase